MASPLRLAVAQSAASLSSPRERVGWLAAQMPRLAADRADMLLLPELLLTGYNIGDLVSDRAEESDGPNASEIAGLAKQFNIAIHYGYVERDGGHRFNSAQCFGAAGKRLGGHRKLVLPPGFEGDHFSQGVDCHLFRYRSVTFGTLICGDTELPEAAPIHIRDIL